jgi:hypothetical protein
MASAPPNASDRERLPFEPSQSRKKSVKADKDNAPKSVESSDKASSKRGKVATQPLKTDKASKSPPSSEKPAKANQVSRGSEQKKASAARSDTAVPEVVSQRMVRRMAFFSGIPTALGMSTFVVSYWIVSHGWFKLPNVAVLLVSLGFFGLGVVGLTYGVLSASWEEEQAGSWLGLGEFSANWGRMTETWKSQRESRASKE